MLPPRQDSPSRPPDWRWERARWLNERGKYARRLGEDPYVLLCKRYQMRHLKANTDVAMEALSRAFPGLFEAHEIRFANKGNTRFLVEAWLLSRANLDEVAYRTTIKPDVVRWYEKCFFNVYDRLDAQDYIVNSVIGAAIHHGVAERDYDVLWKIFAYGGGPAVLAAMTTTFVGEKAVAWFNDDSRGTVARKSAVAARTMPVAFNQAAMLDIYMRHKELEQAENAGGGMTAGMQDNIRRMLSSAGQLFVVGVGAVDSDRFLPYDRVPSELRSSELLSVAAGCDVPESTKLTFPGSDKDV